MRKKIEKNLVKKSKCPRLGFWVTKWLNDVVFLTFILKFQSLFSKKNPPNSLSSLLWHDIIYGHPQIMKNWNLLLVSSRTLNSRTRRPDRAVYVPRAKRSQTTPPTSTTTQSSPNKSHNRKSKNSKSKSIDEAHSTSNSSEDAFDLAEEELINGAVTCDKNCDLIKQIDREISNEKSTNEKNQKNLNNLNTMSDAAKVLTIESAAGINDAKVDKDEKELIKASQEINRSNRKLIKQTFNSNVLEIEAAGGSTEPKTEDKAVNKDDDDWDTL